MGDMQHTQLGASPAGAQGTGFCVWAPDSRTVEVHIVEPEDRRVPMEACSRGYHYATVASAGPGTRYLYVLEGNRERPDPASRFQPQGVHGPSEVTCSEYPWTDSGWHGLPLAKYIFYELHVGTFSPEGTFDGAARLLDYLVELGVTAVELMPLAQFPGCRNWGYDGVYPFAVQNCYGAPLGLKRFVDACHNRGLAVVIDVVCNHLGPEGNYVAEFGPYFTDRHKTPWGRAMNFDGPGSDEVRRYFIENAVYWVEEYHADGLRLDAVHAMFDHSARHFLDELGREVKRSAAKLHRRIYVILESDLNDTRLVRSEAVGGYGLDAQWNDDFHHALHTILTGESNGYYQDFGDLSQLVKAYREGFVYTGQYSPSRQRRHGDCSRALPAGKLVVFSQNHDQVGNRMLGERLSHLVPFEAAKLAAGVVLLSPFLPLLFMGEEYGETAPFEYFVSHSAPQLIEAVRKGRRKEFAGFLSDVDSPDPQDEATFLRCKLNHHLRREGEHRQLFELYRELIRLRKTHPALARLDKEDMDVFGNEKRGLLSVRRWSGESEVLSVFHFGEAQWHFCLPVPAGSWQRLIDSADARWGGAGVSVPETLESDGELALSVRPKSFIVLSKA
jgi:maltooligosyltrehalose trehalohydrolase